jgi:4-alpha-glucanotransferase
MIVPRSSGVLLHPTSLPGPFGIGDLGPAAFAWVEALARAGQAWWQVLPVGPTGYGDSPYQSPSTFAGNTNLLSPERLERDGLVAAADVAACAMPSGEVRYDEVTVRKRNLVRRAWDRFLATDPPDLRREFDAFRAAERGWLDDFALFAAIKSAQGEKPWWEWPAPFAARNAAALTAAAEELADDVDAARFGQFLFARQWAALRGHARRNRVRLIGDLPIYVAHDSADVWANPELFQMDPGRNPTVVAGVPPDYFNPTEGQLWGNPLYDWEGHRRTGFAWWTSRLRGALRLFELVRLDHFRGLAAYWAVPFGSRTAAGGRWVDAPGAELLATLKRELEDLPIIAEDLGVITPDVDALRTGFGLPGMRILQFAFGGAVESRFLPHRFTTDAVVYTGTHDNDTTRGWYEQLTDAERAAFARYAPGATSEPVWALVRLAWASVAELAVVPLQDLLDLGSEARMNTPGISTGNWCWRADETAINRAGWVERVRELTEVYERLSGSDA